MTFNTTRTQNIICPYCGYEDKDSWEVDFGIGLDGDAEIYCSSCDKDFFVSRVVDVKYSSKKI
jgi:hypothetical protein